MDDGSTKNAKGDIFQLQGQKEGFTVMVGTENSRFAFVVTDAKLAGDFLKNAEGVMNTFNTALGTNRTGDAQVKAIMATIGDGSKSGISLYQTAEGDKNRWSRVMAK
jgi:hypothetical protein